MYMSSTGLTQPDSRSVQKIGGEHTLQVCPFSSFTLSRGSCESSMTATTVLFSLQNDLELCLQFVLHFYCTASYLNGFDHKAALFEPVLAGCAVSSLFEMREGQ